MTTATLLLAACGGGGGGGAGTPEGKAAVFLKDAPITTSDGRPSDAVNVEILRVVAKAERADGDSAGDHEDEVTVFEAAPGSGISVNLLDLTVPVLLTTTTIPAGAYDEIEITLNPANATIHFTDNDQTAPLVVSQEGDDEGELEFEFEPPLSIEQTGVSNAVVDFAPVVTLDGTGNYILGHDHENDDTGEHEDVGGEGGAELEGHLLTVDGDLLTLDVRGQHVQVDISQATEFEVDDAETTKDAFLAAIAAGDEIEAKGTFTDGVMHAVRLETGGS